MKRIVSIVAATAALGALGLMGSSAASADSYCPTYYACFWTGTNFTGLKKTVPASQGGQGWITLDGDFRDNIESAQNLFDLKKVCFSTTGDGSGYIPEARLDPWHQITSFQNWNNRIRAFKVTVNNGYCP
ncbi:MAG TPA: peptidase inhibitor family I36 protein [Thermoleophilaceae bacterium]